MTNRVNLSENAPELYQQVIELNNAIYKKVANAGIDKAFSHLLLLRASQINECAFCVRMHTRDAIKDGETMDRVALVAAWRECDYFTDKERAAFELIEGVTTLSGEYLEYAHETAKAVLSDEEIAAIQWLAIIINTWNRIAIASQYKVAP